MPAVLAKLSNVSYEAVKQKLREDASFHATNGMYLQHLRKNIENPDEVRFLFRVNDLQHCRQLMEKLHADAKLQNPEITLPVLTFLTEGE